MENLTPTEIWNGLLALAAAFVLLSNAAEKIGKAIQTAKAPNTLQDERISALEEWKKGVDSKLDSDHQHLTALDAGNRVTQQALLALLDHGLDGNNVKQMQAAKEALESHLINR